MSLAPLTLEEKALLLEGVDSWHTNAVPRLGVRRLTLTDGPHGVRRVKRDAGAFGLAEAEPSTAFPTSGTLAKTWNPDLAREVGAAIGREAAALGVDVLLAPGVNIVRSPLCGRNFEYYSEDPLVSGVFGAAFVAGVQSEGVAACVKHFAANSNEDFRFVGDSIVDERALREIYLRAFERVVTEAEPASVMCAYNRLNGTFCSEHGDLLTGILRDEWGFDGVVVTDWGATNDRVAGIAAGCELDMPGGVEHNRAEIVAAVRDGRLPHTLLDRAVARVLTLADRCTAGQGGDVDLAAHAALAERVAVEGAVLLNNDGVLPLSSGAAGLVVIGEHFEKMRFQGAGSSLIRPPEIITPRQAFDRRGVEYRFAPGYRSLNAEPDDTLEAEAVAAAAGAGTVLFFCGLGDLEESEGFDRPDLSLAAGQRRLLGRLLDGGARLVLVVSAGAPVSIPRADEAAAVLLLSLPGQNGGEAAARLLFGEANPSGRLTESWPRTADDAGCAADWNRSAVARYYESIYVGYRFHDMAGTDLAWPFGHGLSYTTFAYRDLAVEVREGRVHVTVTIANTGPRDGAEVVQLYVRNNAGAVFKADKELRAFTKVAVAAGAAERVELTFPLTDLAYWDVARHGWVVENGDYEVQVAASATDIRLAAPLTVTDGVESRSPYPASVDRAYATPPQSVPAEFAALVGAPIPAAPSTRHLAMQTRLVDSRATLLGGIMYRAVVGRVRRDLDTALALPEGPERDARVKSAHFVWRMMPSMSLRVMVMSSGGVLPHRVAAGLSDLAAGHPVRGVSRLLTRARKVSR
ncbi:glycoside hydrolase family 3 N-terminal domain-containing protein [Tessaracoccus defluvii]|uniref:Exo-alpha-(1->6)-L-arabinopyranosidase n=1 Tax=Tessaracoccus defluvii TaxID=1285901 RepID=A0A7H0H4K2_9ACTN|nr:glycoside hydrolase family 3 N-terminal domain-containing protein [Tessaracoccus defluvii]QNP55468.1 beta-glucosidase [Tessaracoccus defluvii]